MHPLIRFNTGEMAERLKWGMGRIPEESEGKVVSLKELVKIFPTTTKFLEVAVSEEHKHYQIYSRTRKEDQEKNAPVAYQCLSCEEIVMGPPTIEALYPTSWNSPEDLRKINCTNCGHNLEEDILDRIGEKDRTIPLP